MQDSGSSASKGRILVVDDDRLVLATLSHGLKQVGFEVIDADNGDDAILLARSHRPDLALLDIRMEGKSGFDVAAYLRAYCPIPFIFLSAFADQATIDQVEALGAVAYLVKPLDIGQIVPAIEAALVSRHAGVAGARSTAVLSGGPEAVATPTVVAMAAGVLMQRHSIARGPALLRLQQAADAAGRSIAAHAENVLTGIERLAATPH